MSDTGQALTPTEAQVLLEPNTIAGRAAIRTTLLHLAAAGLLRAEGERKKSWLGVSGVRIRPGPQAGALPDHISAVLAALFPPGKPDAPITVSDMASRLRSAFGYDYSRYLSNHVRPRLVQRGLLEVEEYRLLRIIPRRRYRYTALGDEARGWVQESLEPAEHVPELLRRNPTRAAAAAAGLGGLVLIAGELRPHLAELAAAARANPATPEFLALLDQVDEDERRITWLDAAEMMGDLEWGVILDAIDGMADAFDSSDGGGSDSSGDGDGGGDGGGGGE